MIVRVLPLAAVWLGSATSAAAAPAVTTLPIADRPALVTDTTALLSGVVNPNGSRTAYAFQYGRTRAYGRETPPAAAGSGIADVPVDVWLENLEPDTTYHFRLVAFPDPARADYAVARTAGVDRTFRTYPSPGVAFARRRARVTGGTARLVLKAVGPPDSVAYGFLVLRGRRGRIGAAVYRVPAGGRRVVAVRLPRAARRVLARRRTLAVRGTAGRARARIVLRSVPRRRG